MVYHGIILKYRNINHTVCILFSSKCVLCVYVVMTVTHSNNLEKMFAMCQNTQTRLVGLTGKRNAKSQNSFKGTYSGKKTEKTMLNLQSLVSL